MAKLTPSSLTLALLCLFVFTLDVCAARQGPVAEEISFHRDICAGREKVVKLHFYVQDLRIGHVNATVFEVAKASITPKHPTSFGSVRVLDDLITEGPEYWSRELGRTQGLTINADLKDFSIAVNFNFYFSAGMFAGSTLSILGRNQVTDAARELPVVGGTGAFRYARGYAIQTTHSMDFRSSYGVLEYTIYTTYNTYNSKLTENDEDVEIAEM